MPLVQTEPIRTMNQTEVRDSKTGKRVESNMTNGAAEGNIDVAMTVTMRSHEKREEGT